MGFKEGVKTFQNAVLSATDRYHPERSICVAPHIRQSDEFWGEVGLLKAGMEDLAINEHAVFSTWQDLQHADTCLRKIQFLTTRW
jgi:hypothetical protein